MSNTVSPAPEGERPIPADDAAFWDDVRTEVTISGPAPVPPEFVRLCLEGAGRLWIVVAVVDCTFTVREYLPNTNDVDAVLSRIQGNLEGLQVEET